ncbi:MAG: S8 family serine peptidase [Bacteroidota bacterium]
MKPFIYILLGVIFSCSMVRGQEKKVITKAEDLPKHSYAIEIKDAVSFVQNEEAIRSAAALIKADLLDDLETYEFKENATLREYYGNLCIINMIEGHYAEALTYIEKGRLFADKPSEKTMYEIEAEVILNGLMKHNAAESDTIHKTITEGLITKLNAAEFEVIREEIEYLKGRSEFSSKNFLLGFISGDIQPALDNNKGEIPGNLITQLIGMHYVLEYYIPFKEAIQEGFETVLTANSKTAEKVNLWKDREVTLTENPKYASVLIGIWDSGVDMPVLPEKKQWKNPLEKFDGKDTDGNGYVDDVYGIAFDIKGFKSSEYLEPEAHTMEDKSVFQSYMKGYMDLMANIASEEASSLRKQMSEINPKEVESYLDKLTLYNNYSHGTHVAGIAEEGNDMAKIVSARFTINHKAIPDPPNEETRQRRAKSYGEIVAYFKKHKVKVVNMSWGNSYESVLRSYEVNGIGADDAERKTLAKLHFTKQYDAFKEALTSAPEILFVCAAGNANDDVDFTAYYPSSINLPNLITVGAVDIEGKKTSFTAEGKSVDVYANGFEVESYVPGGDRMVSSGTSMAAPNVANLAGKILAVNPQLNPQAVIDIIVKTATTSEEDEKVLLIHPVNAVDLASTR